LLAKSRDNEPNLIECDFRRQGILERRKPAEAEAPAGIFNIFLFFLIDPAWLKFYFATFHQVGDHAYDCRPLAAADHGYFVQSAPLC